MQTNFVERYCRALIVCKCVACFAAFFVLPGTSHPNESTHSYLTMENNLTSHLVVEDVQSGVTGLSGHRWTIEPSGEWEQDRVLNRQTTSEKKGKLSIKQIQSLARELANSKFAELPAQTGKKTINPRLIAIRYGRKNVEL